MKLNRFIKHMNLPYKKRGYFITTVSAACQTLFFLFLFFFFAASVVASPSRYTIKEKGKGDDPTASLTWQADATINNVSFYHAISECNGKKVVFLKFVNKNNYATTVSWKETVKTQMRPSETAARGVQSLTLSPGETLAQDCSASCKACVLTAEQVNPTYLAQIQDYAFTNITVTR